MLSGSGAKLDGILGNNDIDVCMLGDVILRIGSAQLSR